MPGIVDIQRFGVTAERAKVQCIFLHGRNQSPQEMVAAVISRLSTPDVAFALPRAGDKCWYHALAVAPISDQTRAELTQSNADLATLVQTLRAEGGAGMPLVLAGFSQGACLALEHAFGGVAPPDAVVALTGCRVGVAEDQRPSHLSAGLPVYLSAGSNDPWIPLAAFAQAGVELGLSGAVLRQDVFPSRPHEVSAPEIAMLDAVLTDLAGGQTPRFAVAR